MYAGINSVEEIEVDDKGIVWIATHQGLVRYDGSNFSIINSSNSSMQYDNLRAIKYNPTHQKYYIGTLMEGLYVMDTNMQMTHYPFWTPQDIWNSTQVNRITVDLDNDVWMTGYGVIEFDGLTMTRKNAYTSNDGLGDPLCWGIAFDNQNRPWVGSDFLLGVFHDPGTGWISMDSVSHNFPAYNYSNFLGHSNNHVGLIKNIEDELWFCTWTGIVRLRNPTNVKDHSSYFQTKIYPNPTVGELIIESKKPINMISVFNVSGKLVAQISNIKSNRYKYDLFFLPKGIYTIRIENKDQNTEVQKLVLY
ncbi:MAG: T9SS type A sorting domain-containing protein [Flavobacteriales bacterium]|nr:T9SS type A sorting domain-containing protein [Flavobacteriales bacterium]